MDSMAERMRIIGHYATASLKDFLELTRLTEQSRQGNSSDGYVR
jgi:starvation-inducible DNA-binding protein